MPNDSFIPAYDARPMTGSERVHGCGVTDGPQIVDFWRWCCSDLVSNATRGIFAEFLVASALGLATGVRDEWGAYDLRTEDGITVEVKSAAYLQTWEQLKLSTIRFGIRATSELGTAANPQMGEKRRQAKVYVFCLLKHTEMETVDPLNLDQWEFYVVPTRELEELCPNHMGLSLSRIKEIQCSPVDYGGLREAVRLAGA